MSLLGRQFGIAEPVRRGMEMSIVEKGEWTPAMAMGMGSGRVAGDILSGRDCEVGWEDIFTGEFRSYLSRNFREWDVDEY
jgi:proteasome maturation protein